MTVAAGKSLGYGRVGNCFLYVSGKRPPNEADWAEYVAWFKKALPPNAQGIVLERGSGPNAAQRKQLTDITSKMTFKVAVLTASPVARGVVTAMSWFKEGYKAFSPDELGEAASYLGLDASATSQVKQLVQKLLFTLDAV